MDESFVCYLDILGYSHLVAKYSTIHEELLKVIKEILVLTDEMIQLCKDVKHDDQLAVERLKLLSESFRVHMFSDSILLSMTGTKAFEKGCTYEEVFNSFAQFISYFLMFFYSKIGFMFEGGVSFGEHSEENLDELSNIGRGVYVFSPTMIKAYKMMNKAKNTLHPVIMIDENVLQKISSTNEYVYNDISDKILDPYYIFTTFVHKEKAKNICKQIADSVRANMEIVSRNEEGEEKSRAAVRLKWFCDYHNVKMESMGFSDHR